MVTVEKKKAREKLEWHNRYMCSMCSNACGCSVPLCLECGNSRCDSESSSGEPDLSRAHLAHSSTSTTATKR
jgi:hypothetical protein